MTDTMGRDSFISKRVPITKVAFPMDRLRYKDVTYLIMAAFTKVKFPIVKLTDKAPTLTPFKTISIQACGKTISHMEKANKNSEMVHITREIFKKASSKVTDIMFVSQECTKGSSPKEISMGREHSATLTAEFTKGSGLMGCLLAMEYSRGLMATDMRESIRRD